MWLVVRSKFDDRQRLKSRYERRQDWFNGCELDQCRTEQKYRVDQQRQDEGESDTCGSHHSNTLQQSIHGVIFSPFRIWMY